jgi:hypothetical protein
MELMVCTVAQFWHAWKTEFTGGSYSFFLYSLFNCSSQLEKGVDGLFDSFARLDTRISSVGQTAAKIGDHLQVICSSEYLYFCIYYAYLLIVRL